MKFFNRFFGKLIFLLLVLNILLVLDYFNYININNIKSAMYENINFTRLVDVFKGEVFDDYYGEDISVNGNIYILNSNDGNRLVLETNEVICIDRGQVIKISRTDDKLYKVYIQSKDNIYVYGGLKEIDIEMYEIVNVNSSLGKSDYYDNSFYCFIEILSNNSTYENSTYWLLNLSSIP